MRTAKEYLKERLGVYAYKKIVDAGIEGFVISAFNKGIKEAIEECADDAKQQQIADAIAAFEKTIADLTAQINSGAATPEQLQTVVDNLNAAKTDLEATPVA